MFAGVSSNRSTPFTESSPSPSPANLSPSKQTESLVTGFASNSRQSSFVTKMASGVVNGKCDVLNPWKNIVHHLRPR